MGGFGLGYLAHDARTTIHLDHIAVVPQFDRVLDSCNARQSVFSSNQGAMLEEPADLKNHASGIHEKRRPSGVGATRHQYLSL